MGTLASRRTARKQRKVAKIKKNLVNYKPKLLGKRKNKHVLSVGITAEKDD